MGQLALLALLLVGAGARAAPFAPGLLLAAAPGVLGALWRRDAGERGTVLAAAWALGCGGAAATTGGLGGPLGPYALAAVVAALGVGVGARWAIAAGVFAATVAVLFAPRADAQALAGGLRWAATAAVVVLAAVVWRRDRPASPVETAPDRRTAQAAVERDAAIAARDAALLERDGARETAEARTRFLAAMSHELRTPLNAVIGFSDIMKTRLFGPLPERYADYAGLIHESGEHLLALINDVLDLAKMEAGRWELRREVVDAREALNAALRITRGQADEAGIDLRAAPAPGPVMVDADARALKQMALNLLGNALKFTGRGGHVTAGVSATGGALELVVADTGVGIAPEELERLGRPFEQARSAEGRGGTGLGLSLVRSLAELHGGTLHIESRLGAGTAVTVRLPVLVVSTTELAQ